MPRGDEYHAIKLGKAAPADHTVKALRIVEDLRAVALGKGTEPKHVI